MVRILAAITLPLLVSLSNVAWAQTEPFSATGQITSIDAGEVKPAGKSGRFVVQERHVEGTLTGDINGEFLMTYTANVPITTQSGQLHGTLDMSDNSGTTYVARFQATSSMGLTPLGCDTSDGITCIGASEGNFVPGLLINGTLTFTEGSQGYGMISAWIVPELDPEGHILGVVGSQITIGGQWKS